MNIVSPADGFVTLDGQDISLHEFKEKVKAGEDVFSDDLAIHKSFAVDIVKAAGDRSLKTVISDGKKDRDDDTINSEGWDISDYEKNPVVLWAHDPTQPPIAKSVVKVYKSKLVSLDTFPDEGVYDLADTVLNLAKGGFINAKSVGFLPTEFQFDEKVGGFDFQKQSLLEHSYVPVPANPRALIVARSHGINMLPIVRWANFALKNISDEAVAEWLEQVEFASGSTATFTIGEPLTTEKTMGDKAKEKESVLSEETQEFLDKAIEMKRLENTLKEEGFSEKEVEPILSRVRDMEGVEPVVEEKTEKATEDSVEIPDDVVKEAVNDVIGDLRNTVTSLTGKVN
jgi:hypothetical protein